MLTITVPYQELWDEDNNVFVNVPETTMELEHSLAALSKWESKHEKPFLSKDEKSASEILDYIRCMVLTPGVPEVVFKHMTQENLESINNYIDSKATATWFNEPPNSSKSREIITSELIYYWMITNNIPLEFENRHLSHLFTLLKVFNLKNSKPKKMGRSEVAQRNRDLNAQRRAQLGTSG